MKSLTISLVLATASLLAQAAEEEAKNPLKIHKEGADQLVEEQDELSADVQQLVVEQTQAKVIELLGKVEDIMDEATDRLTQADTGGETIAAQTEIIELIHAAAKEKQKQNQSGSKSGGAMMEMMERMMGKTPEGDKPGEKPGQGKKPGDSGGQGQTGDSNTPNEHINGAANGSQEIRRVPKSSGTTSQAIPLEFRKAFDAYNRGAEQQIK